MVFASQDKLKKNGEKIAAENFSKLISLIAKGHNNFHTLSYFQTLSDVKKSIKEKLEAVNEAITEAKPKTEKDEIRKAAYKALHNKIFDYNIKEISNKKVPELIKLDTVGTKYEEEDNKLWEIIHFIKEYSKTNTKQNPVANESEPVSVESQKPANTPGVQKTTKSAFYGFFEEVGNLATNLFTDLSKFIKNPREEVLKNMDGHVTDSLNRARQFLKSDPTKRTWKNRALQLAGGSLNTAVWFGKQCVNVVRKPIAATGNLVKTTFYAGKSITPFIGSNEREDARKKCGKHAYDFCKDVVESAIAAGTLYCVAAFSPVAAPIAIGISGIAVVGAGLATAIMAGANASAVMMTAPGIAAQAGENTAKALYIGAEYVRTSKDAFTDNQKAALSKLYEITKTHNDSKIRQEALEKMNYLENHIKKDLLKRDNIGKGIEYINNIGSNTNKFVNKITGGALNPSSSPKNSEPNKNIEH